MKEIRTLESIDFNEITSVVERDCLRTSLVGDNLKNRFLRAKYFIALVRCALHVPRQGPDTNTPWRTFSQAPGNMQLSAKLIGYFPAAFTPQEQTEFRRYADRWRNKRVVS